MAKKTYADLLGTIQVINAIVQSEPNTISSKKLVKFGQLIQPLIDEYNDRLEDLKLDNCSVDSNNNLILDEKGNYTYGKDNSKALKNEIKRLLASEFDFTPIQVNNPKGLENFHFLEGWVNGVEFNKQDIKEEDDIEL